MQIMPSGGAWTNPAALTQQALGDSKQSAAPKNATNSAEPVTPLEQSGKTADRDAQERYDGPQPDNRSSQSVNSTETVSDSESMLTLPADDDLEPGTLDLLG